MSSALVLLFKSGVHSSFILYIGSRYGSNMSFQCLNRNCTPRRQKLTQLLTENYMTLRQLNIPYNHTAQLTVILAQKFCLEFHLIASEILARMSFQQSHYSILLSDSYRFFKMCLYDN